MYTDEELISKYRQGEIGRMDELISRYKNYVRAKSRSYFLTGGEQEDLVQEGMIGLFKAIRDFNPEKNPQFKSFAMLCVARQLATALKISTREKHLPLNNYISFYRNLGEDVEVKDILEASDLTPEQIVIGKESIAALSCEIENKLSALEKKVLYKYIEGISYRQISEQLRCNKKTIDNALQRIKKKLSQEEKQ